MICSFHADDQSGLYAALLTAHGLAQFGLPAAVLRPERHRRRAVTVFRVPETEDVTADLSGHGLPGAARALVDEGRVVLVALPASALGDATMSAGADLRVLTTGVSLFGAASAVAAREVHRARTAGTVHDGPRSKLWTLPCAGAFGPAPTESWAEPVLSFVLPRLGLDEARSLVSGYPCATLLLKGAGLASALLTIAEQEDLTELAAFTGSDDGPPSPGPLPGARCASTWQEADGRRPPKPRAVLKRQSPSSALSRTPLGRDGRSSSRAAMPRSAPRTSGRARVGGCS